ncbi:MAG TPA: 2TM domain-containing protein [Hyphomicrobium sp.]|uniref:2TM domain-containing protein n=1 Tax=Hyphomicrobium sp. TaxID=82 RepID=UPI002BF4687B|nr:2TM domain-containing protein [Hyphomicrobium sp.]HRN89571.1 2TM domain-containing protein [Hyphomicrobium sp.]
MSAMDDLRRDGVLIHGAIYAAVILLLIFVDWYGGGRWWVHWVILGWGAGLAAHAWLSIRG